MELILADYVYPVAGAPFAKGGVLVDQGKIVAVGTEEELAGRVPKSSIKRFQDACLMPGLVNAHTHLDLTLFPAHYLPLVDDPAAGSPRTTMGFVDWIASVIQYRRSVPQQTFADAIAEGIDRCIRSGTTAIGEISTLDGEFSILETKGIRSVMFPELISFDSEKARDSFEAAVALLDRYSSRQGRVRIGLSPHAPYTVSRPLLKIVQDYARESGFAVQIHTAESFQEMEFFFDAGGEINDKLFPMVGWTQFKPPTVRKTPIQYLHSIDFLKCKPSLVHCVQVSDADLDVLASMGCKVALCPRSNHFLQVGKAPYARFRERGIPMGLGTDSLASNASLSLWDEMRFLKRSWNQSADLLHLATRGSAEVLGLSQEIGSLEPDKQADLILVRVRDVTDPSQLADSLVDHTHDADVLAVAVGGDWLYEPNQAPMLNS